MDATILTIIAIAVVLVIALIAVAIWYRKRNSNGKALREHFGPEYDRAVAITGDKKAAENDLMRRQQRVSRYRLRALSATEWREFADGWRHTEARFVDEPSQALVQADQTVVRVMQARGYESRSADECEDDLSVHHPLTVGEFRRARQTMRANERDEATTEELRQAMIQYRAILEALLQDGQENVGGQRREVSAR